VATILIVDDRPVERQVYKTLLGHNGYRVLEAGDGAQALELARAECPDLIITDLLMPKMDGFVLVRNLRAEPRLANIPVIFQTANYAEAEAQKLALAYGVQHILTKPVELQAVLDLVSTALSQSTTPIGIPHGREIDDEHLQLLVDKLYQKASELESINAQVDARIREKTQELEVANARLQNLAVTDELTGLNNRRGFNLLAEELLKLARRSGYILWLVYADLNDLKHINDSFGHAAGDDAIINIAKILLKTFRESDVIARIGGDEFAILMIDSSVNSSEVIQARLQSNLNVHNHQSVTGYALSLSMGAIRVDLDSSHTIDELLSQADSLMYVDKRRQKQRR
jgi:diguanylate cyclase (GGDEF)-like protein